MAKVTIENILKFRNNIDIKEAEPNSNYLEMIEKKKPGKCLCNSKKAFQNIAFRWVLYAKPPEHTNGQNKSLIKTQVAE